MSPRTEDAPLSRRTLLALGALAALAGTGGLAGCAAGSGDLVVADVARRPGDPARVPALVDAVGAFGADLLAAVGDEGNLVCSPWSVLVALAMVRHGATGTTAAEMDAALHLPDLAALGPGLSALNQLLATRSGRRENAEGEKATVVLDTANRVWGQQGSAWERPFLEDLATWFGTGVAEADLEGSPERARLAVNAWVADQTHDRVEELVPSGSIGPGTRMVLANAVHVRAPWRKAFTPGEPLEFAAPDGPVTVPSMGAVLAAGGVVGEGWTAARVPLAGAELALTVIRPDVDLATLRRALRGDGLARLLRREPDRGVALRMPPVELRTALELSDVLRGLGMRRAFTPEAEFDGMTRSERLAVGRVHHQGWLALDEEGLEAAAATGVTMEAVSAVATPLQLTLDRPYLACLHDVGTALPLLLVQVVDPTAAAA